MKRNEAYKDSGVDWIGEIPEGWEVVRFKRLFREKKKVTNASLNSGSISFGEVVYKDDEKITEATKQSYQVLSEGEFLLNPLNMNYDLKSLRIGLSAINVVVSSGYIILQSKNDLDKSYYRWLLRIYDIVFMKTLGAGVRQTINFNDLADSHLVFPPLPEQTAIAQFLDDKTAKIDQTIGIRQKEIELLKERRQILIQQAVTGKIVWDASTNAWTEPVEVKDSGVDWIGEIPAHWEVRKLRRVGNIVNGATPSSSETAYWNGEIVWVTPTDINNIKIIYDSERKISEAGYRNCGTTRVPIGSVVLTTRAPIGKVVIAGTELCTNQGCKSVVIDEKLIGNKFLYYQILINSETLNGLGSGTTFKELSNKELKDFKINLPKLPEQTEIVSYLEKIEEKTAKAIALKEQEIEKLKEYKTVLIDNVVTGKVRVS